MDVGFLCDEVPMTVAMLRDTVKWTVYIFMSNMQQGKTGFDYKISVM